MRQAPRFRTWRGTKDQRSGHSKKENRPRTTMDTFYGILTYGHKRAMDAIQRLSNQMLRHSFLPFLR